MSIADSIARARRAQEEHERRIPVQLQLREEQRAMFYVRLVKPLPGIRSEVFVFHTDTEADEFASTLHSRFDGVETEQGSCGEATEVFPEWTF